MFISTTLMSAKYLMPRLYEYTTVYLICIQMSLFLHRFLLLHPSAKLIPKTNGAE